jgi:hypothetical protein
MFNYFSPSVANIETLLKNENVLFKRKGLLLYFWVQEINPSFPTLFTISQNGVFTDGGRTIFYSLFFKILIKQLRDVVPMFNTVLIDNSNQFIVFFFYPVTFLYLIFLFLIESIQTLRIISSWNKS